jgi:isochorismate synthase
MNSFAVIYIPHLNKTFSFEEVSDDKGTMYIENFGASRRIHFQESVYFPFPDFQLSSSSEIAVTKNSYKNLVNNAINEINKGEYTKLVCAQQQVINRPSKLADFRQMFQQLIISLPNTFVYLFYLDGELWLGASPEIVGIWKENEFSTISLAGTQKENNFSNKEVEEQAIVSDFISSQFQQINTRTVQQTQILSFGGIKHLMSEFAWSMEHISDFETAVQTIHPSPALAGMPKEKSVEFILSNESIQRKFYTGLVSIHFTDSAYSFAAIRCARITENQIIFYAGAGITKDSDAEAEWEETLEKINVLKKALTL